MGMTATQLGSMFSRTGTAMNQLLRDHGFIEGGPGAWRATELGKQFIARAHDVDNGYGGLAHRQWGWLSWTDGLVDALRASMEANPDGVVASAAAPAAVVPVASRPAGGADGHGFSRNQWAALAVLGVLAASAPVAGRAWNERVRPAASQVRDRIAKRRSAAGTAGADADDAEQ